MTPSLEVLFEATPALARLAEVDRKRLARVASVRVYARGETIFKEGDPPDFCYVLARGRVKVFKRTPDGKDVLLEVLGPGDPFGAVSVYEGRPCPATASALETSTCVLVPRRSLFDLIERHPALVRGLLPGLTRRFVDLAGRMAELTGGRVELRLASLLLRLAGEKGRPDFGGVFVPVALSRRELADMTGTTTETCIRIMSRWGRQRIVETRKDGFVIRDIEALAEVSTA